MNKRIRFARGIRSKILASDIVPANGQPVYNKTDNTLLIGDGTTPLKNLSNLTVTDVANTNGNVSISSSGNVNISATSSVNISPTDSTTIDNLYLKVVELDNNANNNYYVNLAIMEPNTYYLCTGSNLHTLIIGTLKTPSLSNTTGEYIIEFTVAENSGYDPVVRLPNGVIFANNWGDANFLKGYKYVIYILHNIAYVSFVEV